VVDNLSPGDEVRVNKGLVRSTWQEEWLATRESPSVPFDYSVRSQLGATYSRTLWCCRGCSKGLPAPGPGVEPSETDGANMLGRVLGGLKGPGEEAGVVLAVRKAS
jgi:hypothetical protein